MGMAYDSPEAADEKLRKRIGWLNKNGFEGKILYDKIIDAAFGVEYAAVMEVLQQLEAKKGSVNDPTGWCCVALKKKGGRGGNTMAAPAPMAMAPAMNIDLNAMNAFAAQLAAMQPMMAAASAGGGGRGGGGGSVEEADSKLRKRINWLNGKGGFNNNLQYDKIFEAAKGVEYAAVMDMLKQVEAKRDEVRDACSWVCAALRKAGRAEPSPVMGMPMGMQGAMQMPMTAYGLPAAFQAFQQEPQAMDVEGDQKVRKRIGWLNKQVFDGQIVYQKVMEAASHGNVGCGDILSVLKDLEAKKDEIKDPTAYVGAALRKRGGKGSGRGGAPMGVQRTIAKPGR
eukprot:TRINITY_DN112551_c0_g1_i1.p1 TRINITY_DN112551_c0_g1~~TRINITY_DN112551_c0_g1_i1.p1  ORF type:complete len:340 (+),score=107.96 TRINITY_DN112551_c0_g1_i1:94-1113(+)